MIKSQKSISMEIFPLVGRLFDECTPSWIVQDKIS